jgi:hypothetical protein
METNEHTEIDDEVLQSEITCQKYREAVTSGVQITRNFTDITFNFDSIVSEGALPADSFSAPSIILYDSFDRHVHNSQSAINSYHYMEYGEVWFDGHYISTSARNIEAHVTEKAKPDSVAVNEAAYKISVARYDDHLLLKLESAQKTVDVIVALPDVSKSAYIALTAENGSLYEIKVEVTEKTADEKTIPRIAEHISYIDHIESDLPNIQITAPCAEYTKGVAVKDRLKICFHTMSLPEANLVWHCPYIVLYSSEDGTVGGKNYRVYAFIKLNGEDNGSNEYAENSFVMRRTEQFENWNTWKEDNKAGYECKIEFEKKGSRIILKTENLGVFIENITNILEMKGEVYVALTGDQCALTDIRVY